MNTTTAAIVSDSIAAASWAADEDFDRGGDYRRRASNVGSGTTTTIVTDPDSPVEDFDSPEEDEDFHEEEDETSNGDGGEDDGDTYEDCGAEIFKCHDDDDDDAYNKDRNDNDDISHSTMMWHRVRQDQAGHEIDCEAFSSDSSEEEADDEEEFGDDDDDDDDAEDGIELEEDEQRDEGDLSDSGDDDGTDEHHDVDDIIIDEDEDDDDDYGSSQEYETDEDSLDDANECDPTMVDVDNDDDGASASQQQQQHELFLPVETAPTIESLKYEEEDDDDESNSTDDSSSNEDDDDDDDDDEDDDTQLYPQRTYIIEQNNRNSGRPRMWDGSYNAGKPPLPSISSSLSRSSSSLTSKKRHKFKESCSIANTATATSFSSRHRRRRSGVTFNNSVTVYPIFKTSVYTPTMILALYTQRDELRVNKLRNKREYAYEDYDWRNAVEEIDMTYSPSTGSSEQLVHPVHATTTTTTKDKTVKSSSSNSRSPSPRNVVQTYSSAFGGYINGSSMTSSLHGAKRMRMYYP